MLRYGDKDRGPKKSRGDSADGDAAPDDATKADDAKADPAPEKPPLPADASAKPPEDKPADDKPAGADTAADKPADAQASGKALTDGKPSGAGPLPPDINLPQVESSDSHAEKDGAPGQATDDTKVNMTPSLSTEQVKQLADAVSQPPRPETRPVAPSSSAPHLTKAKKLFSHVDGDGAIAMTAMGNLSRGSRIGQLCATELGLQLLHAGYPVDVLPKYPTENGTVVDQPISQFFSNGMWYNVSFRCEVDADATKVVSISYKIGGAVPRSEWRSRGFPVF